MYNFSKLLLLVIGLFLSIFSFAQTSTGALDFDGVNDYVQGTNDSLPKGNSSFTIEAWIKPSSTQNGTIFNWGDQSQGNRAGLIYVIGRLYFVGGPGVLGTASIPLNTWSHVAATYNGIMLQLYVNGIPDGSGALSLATTGTTFRFGCSTPPAMVEFFKGQVDEVRVWNKALTACDISNNMHKRFAEVRPGLISYFGFNQGEINANNTIDSLLDDKTDNSLNATLKNFSLNGSSSNWVANNPLVDSVYAAPRSLVIQNPDSSSACINNNLSFVAYANVKSAKLNYQWTRNGINIPGATDSTLVTSSLNNMDTIRCIIFTNNSCLPATLVSNAVTVNILQPVYTFTGNGSWDVSSNWADGNIPPGFVPPCISIVIDPVAGGECLLEDDLLLLKGSSLSVMPGKSFRVTGNLQILDSAELNALSVFADTIPRARGLEFSAESSNIPYVEDELNSNSAHLRPAAAPQRVELPMPPAGDQGKTLGSCATWSVVYGAMSYIYKRFERNESYDGPDKKLSPAYLFYQKNQGQNNGMSLLECLDLMTLKGSPKYVDLQGDYEPYFLTAPHPNNVQYAPLYNGLNFLNHKDDWLYRRLGDFDIEKVKDYLADSMVIVFGAYVDGNFQTGKNAWDFRRGRAIYLRHDGNRNKDNKHGMVLCGYDDTIKAFKILNSWGEDWGKKGFCWIKYEVLKSMLMVSKNGYEAFRLKPVKPSVAVTTVRNTFCSSTPSINTTITAAPGITVFERGICYWDEKNPTTGIHLSGYSHTLPVGSGAGTFDAAPDYLLTQGYYIRAYAKTSKGIVYGNEVRVEPLQVTIAAGGNGSGSAPNQLRSFQYIGMDQYDNLYVLDRDRVQKWAPGATSGTTVAGGNGFGSAANQWSFSDCMFVDKSGNIYIADRSNYRIQKWAPGATSGVTVAGISGQPSLNPSDFTRLGSPSSITVDNQGNIYIVEDNPRQSFQGGIVIKWAPGVSSGVVVAGGNGQGYANNQLLDPTALCVDGFGALYIADGDRIMKWIPGASSGVQVAVGTGYTSGITLDTNGNIYYADYSNHRVMRWVLGATSGVVVAGGCPSWGIAQLDSPYSVVLDSQQNIYVDHSSNYSVKKWPKYD